MDGETIVTVRCKSVLSGSSKEQIDMNQTCLETAVKISGYIIMLVRSWFAIFMLS